MGGLAAGRSARRLSIVVVEDDEIDLERIERAFRRLEVEHPRFVARDGLEALSLLRGEGDVSVPKPHVLLMDLNMPRMNGIELLEEIRRDPALASTPVFVLTTSERSADVAEAYRFHVAGYVVKPLTNEGVTELLRRLDALWEIALFPESGS